MIFHRLGAGVICILIFFPLIWWGFFKLVFWHFPRFHLTGNRSSARFLYHFGKALDQAGCSGAFSGKCDETISNKAGRIFLERGFSSQWWVLVTKKITDRMEPNHIENSLEPVRPDEWDGV